MVSDALPRSRVVDTYRVTKVVWPSTSVMILKLLQKSSAVLASNHESNYPALDAGARRHHLGNTDALALAARDAAHEFITDERLRGVLDVEHAEEHVQHLLVEVPCPARPADALLFRASSSTTANARVSAATVSVAMWMSSEIIIRCESRKKMHEGGKMRRCVQGWGWMVKRNNTPPSWL